MSLSDEKNTPIEELLDDHAAALLAGRDFHPHFDAYDLTTEAKQESYDLLYLAQRLRETLTPAQPDEAFLARLKDELVGDEASNASLWYRWRMLPPRYRVAASLGGLTLTAGIAWLALRRFLDALQPGDVEEQADSEVGLSFNTAS